MYSENRKPASFWDMVIPYIALVVVLIGLNFALSWNNSLPVVYYNLESQPLCAFSSDGEWLPLDSVVGRASNDGGIMPVCPDPSVSAEDNEDK